jgi:hypothetical protein
MINIIGAGMAGSIMAKLLRREGIEFNLFDCKKPGRASIISENLIGVKWYKDQKKLVDYSLAILKDIVPVRLIKGPNPAWHVYTKDLLEQNFIEGEAIPSTDGVHCHGQFYRGLNIICTGSWAPGVTASSLGHGIIMDGPVEEEVIMKYKPFRFQKLINRNPDESWYSNSLAIKPENYKKRPNQLMNELFDDLRKFPNLITRNKTYVWGLRPVKDHETVYTKQGIVITGGNKSGMVYYPAQCAKVIYDVHQYIQRNLK